MLNNLNLKIPALPQTCIYLPFFAYWKLMFWFVVLWGFLKAEEWLMVLVWNYNNHNIIKKKKRRGAWKGPPFKTELLCQLTHPVPNFCLSLNISRKILMVCKVKNKNIIWKSSLFCHFILITVFFYLSVLLLLILLN